MKKNYCLHRALNEVSTALVAAAFPFPSLSFARCPCPWDVKLLMERRSLPKNLPPSPSFSSHFSASCFIGEGGGWSGLNVWVSIKCASGNQYRADSAASAKSGVAETLSCFLYAHIANTKIEILSANCHIVTPVFSDETENMSYTYCPHFDENLCRYLSFHTRDIVL